MWWSCGFWQPEVPESCTLGQENDSNMSIKAKVKQTMVTPLFLDISNAEQT